MLVNGTQAPLLAVARVNGLDQINFQIPFETAPGTTSFIVKNGASSEPAISGRDHRSRTRDLHHGRDPRRRAARSGLPADYCERWRGRR